MSKIDPNEIFADNYLYDGEIEYKGFIGTRYYSTVDNCWCGKIKNIKDVVAYESETQYDLYNKFKDKYDEIFNYMRNNYNFKVFFTKELENFEKGVIDV